jgi:hypothetical protein
MIHVSGALLRHKPDEPESKPPSFPQGGLPPTPRGNDGEHYFLIKCQDLTDKRLKTETLHQIRICHILMR